MRITNRFLFWTIILFVTIYPFAHYLFEERNAAWMLDIRVISIWRGIATILILFGLLYELTIFTVGLLMDERKFSIRIEVKKPYTKIIIRQEKNEITINEFNNEKEIKS